MAYFAQHYRDVSLPISGAQRPGFRNAQLGAIHAVSSHFTIHRDPALVVMPTGSGKTAVYLTLAFLLRPRRVLIVTPSRLVRDQVAKEAASLKTLRRLGAVAPATPGASVESVRHRVATRAAWRALAQADMVVGTPSSLSPGIQGVATPPGDLFDLLLVDEAHHLPAPTWTALANAFPGARTVLFTATPFRLDEREVHGRVVYDYPLGRALDDGILCALDFVPVPVTDLRRQDAVLARRAEAVLRQEQKRDPTYRLLVRTDRRGHAEELAGIYARETALTLRTVHSGHSQRHVERQVEALKTGALDGLLCVDMLGEGFDFPPLKVAAIHRKHKSLPVTLQFIGRFGRVTRPPGDGQPLERAKILAVPEQLEDEIRHLYAESAFWQQMIPTLHDARIERDRRTRKALDTFRVRSELTLEDLEGVSLWSMEPLAHVKIYEVKPGVKVDIQKAPPAALGKDHKVVYHAVSPPEEFSAAVLLAREKVRAEWTKLELFQRVQYDLVVVHWNADARLLFLCSSRRGSLDFYETLARHYTRDEHRLLPLFKINRVLRGLGDVDCFNLGMRSRVASRDLETYRILAGPEVQRAVDPSDAIFYHRGHVMVGIPDGEKIEVLGYSSSAKVWLNQKMRVPELVEWCRGLAEEIARPGPVKVGNQLDSLPASDAFRQLPEDLIAATWDDTIYRKNLRLVYPAVEATATSDAEAEEREVSLLDTQWTIEHAGWSPESVPLTLEAGDARWTVRYTPGAWRLFAPLDGGPTPPWPKVRSGHTTIPLIDTLNQMPLHLYTASLARLHGTEIFSNPGRIDPIDPARFHPLPWTGVDITKEFGWLSKEAAYTRQGFDPTTIHGHLATYLPTQGFPILFYDHGSGEMADFIAIEPREKGQRERFGDDLAQGPSIDVFLYHVKGAGGLALDDRVGDVYEVSGQVIKSLIWTEKNRRFIDRLAHREAKVAGPFFLQGDLAQARALLGDRRRPLRFFIGLVQPGISPAAAPKLRQVLAAADAHVRRSLGTPIFMYCSPTPTPEPRQETQTGQEHETG
jgi:superfamily II DNA or RNA helicase